MGNTRPQTEHTNKCENNISLQNLNLSFSSRSTSEVSHWRPTGVFIKVDLVYWLKSNGLPVQLHSSRKYMKMEKVTD